MIGTIAAPAAFAQFVVAPAGTPSGAPHLHGDHSQNPGGYICGTNYSMNSVDGKYCPPRQAAQLALSAAVPPILPAPRTPAARAAYERDFGPQSLAAAKQPPLPRNAKFSLAGLPPASTPAMIARVTGPGSGFDWADAGIGAAGGIGLSILGLAAALTLAQRRGGRQRRSSRSTA